MANGEPTPDFTDGDPDCHAYWSKAPRHLVYQRQDAEAGARSWTNLREASLSA